MSKFRFADLFCGAGGFTSGAERSGIARGVLAVNHWRPAIYTHEKNHPHVRHVCASLDHVDPRDFEREGINMLLASPECIFHSDARGAKPIDDQRRSTAWCIPRWVEAIRPKWFVIENVKEFEKWAPLGSDNRPLKSRRGEIFKAWIGALRSLNYHAEWKLLNSADYGAATKRIRLFIVGRRGASKQPFRWPQPTHAEKEWVPAASIIDWSLPCPSIFGRKKDLKPKTIDRIAVGLRKFCGPDVAEPFIVKMRGMSHTADIQLPLPTITAGGTHLGLCKPFLVKYHGGTSPTNDGTNRQYSLLEPLPTIDTQPRFGLAAPFLMDVNHGRVGTNDDRSYGADKPLPTVTTKRGQALVLPFLTEYYGNGGARSVDEPLSTVTTRHRHGLAIVKLMQEMWICDIGFRMLKVPELSAAMGFAKEYELFGNQEDQIKQIGNAVHTHVAEAIVRAIGDAA